MDLENQRLFLRPINIEQAQKLMIEPDSYTDWLDVPFDSLWPHDGLKAMLPIYVEALENNPEEYGFGPWIMIDKHKQMVIGDIGFKGLPVDGIVEIGYYVSKIHRNQGYAKEAVDSMLQWAFSHKDIDMVTASCQSDNVPSCKVLESCGFKRSGEVDGFTIFQNRKERQYGRGQAM